MIAAIDAVHARIAAIQGRFGPTGGFATTLAQAQAGVAPGEGAAPPASAAASPFTAAPVSPPLSASAGTPPAAQALDPSRLGWGGGVWGGRGASAATSPTAAISSGVAPSAAAGASWSGAWGAGLPAAGQPWAGAIEAAAQRAGIDPPLLAAVAWAESGFKPDARSHAGAVGMTQLMPGTARELGVDPADPLANLDGGARYLRQQLDRFGSVELALAAYNAGPGRVAQAGGVPQIAETQAYVRRVADYYDQLR